MTRRMVKLRLLPDLVLLASSMVQELTPCFRAREELELIQTELCMSRTSPGAWLEQ
jgi:hypothetical protein